MVAYEYAPAAKGSFFQLNTAEVKIFSERVSIGIWKIDESDSLAICRSPSSFICEIFSARGPASQPVSNADSSGNCVHQVGIFSSVRNQPAFLKGSLSQNRSLNSNINLLTDP